MGCCSRFQKCSEVGECVWDYPDAKRCFYRTNLDRGLNFYSDRPLNTATQVIIEIGGRAFKVLRHEKGLSYRLSENEASLLRSMLKTANENSLYIREDSPSATDPATYRVEFVYNGTRFNILNFDGYLLPKKTCDTITQSIVDTFPNVCTVSVGFIEKYAQKPAKENSLPVESPKKVKPPSVEQISLF